MSLLIFLKNVCRTNKRYFSSSYSEGKNLFFHKKKRNEIIVLHPVINKKNERRKNSYEEIILDAQEALGLARSANFKIVRGISMPMGGWNAKKSEKKEGIYDIKYNNEKVNENENNKENENENDKENEDDKENENKKKNMFSYHSKRDNYYDHQEKESFTNLRMIDVERKIAESVIIKLHHIDNQFYFGKGKLNEIGKYYLKNPTPYIFINTLLSPEHRKNLDYYFNNLLKSYQSDMKLEKEKKMFIEREMIRRSEWTLGDLEEPIQEENPVIDSEERASEVFHQFYNDYARKEIMENSEEDEEDFDWLSHEKNSMVSKNESESNITEENKCKKENNIPLYVEIFDRYSIILYIFKKRASNNVTKLQVEIARAKFTLNNYAEDNRSRIKYFQYIQNNVLSKSFSDYEEKCNDSNLFNVNKKENQNFHYSSYTTNFIKSGETYKEYEKRIINNLFNKLKKELEKCKRNQNLQNKSRNHKALISIVGYTNVGKTELINFLTKSNLKAKNVLFQTLDNSYKNLHIANSYSTVLVDSIGFIQNIPYSLFEAFKLSLEAIKNADIIIHVIDVTHPCKEKHKKCVLDTLQNICISENFIKNSVIEVWNKIDKLSETEMMHLLKNKPINALPISAYYGTNCDILIKIIQNLINKIKNVQVVTLQFKTSEAQKRIEFLSKHFKVIPNSISYSDDGNTTSIQLVENLQNLKKYYEKFGY